MTKFITRDYPLSFETKEENNMGVIEGRPIVFDERTDIGFFDEIINRDALKNTDLRDVRLCLNHDTSFVYARSRNNNENSTMQLGVDDKGLYFRAKLDIENSPKAQDYYSAIKRGDIDKMSFMFSVPEGGDSWDWTNREHPVRTINSIDRVLEVSAVTFPAYESTSISARDKESLDNDKLALENAKKRELENSQRSLDSELELAKAKFEALIKVR